MSHRPQAFLLALLGCLGCSFKLPSESVRDQARAYAREHSDKVTRYAVGTQQRELAWAGDPKNPPLIFVHGSPGSWEGWAHFLRDQKLTEKFHVIAVTRAGYAGTARGTPELSLREHAAGVAAALKLNKSGAPALLVGHSYGGPVVVQTAVDFPQLVAGIALVAASVDPSLEETKWYQRVARWRIASWMVPLGLRVCNEEILGLKRELELLDQRWQELKVPTYVLHGDADPLVPIANVGHIQSRLPRGLSVKVRVLEGMNHFIPWQAPGEISAAVEWLSAATTE